MSTDIECKLVRKGGTEVPLGTTTYLFAPREDGAHVAAVANDEHVARFLSIPEAYRLYRGKTAPAPVPVHVAPQVASDGEQPSAKPQLQAATAEGQEHTALLGSSEHPATFEIHGKTYSLGDIVALAHTGSGLDVKEWNELDDTSRADLIDEQLDKLSADTNGDGTIDNAEERAALVEQYIAKHGKKPHYNLSVAKLREAVAG